MDADDLRRFAARPWDKAGDLKLRFLAERFAREGSAGARRAARRLSERFRRLRSAGASREAREQDFSAHVELKSRMDRASLALRRR